MSGIHDLANGEATTRSYVLCVYASFSYDDFTSGVGLPFCTLPVGAIVLGGILAQTVAWNSGTSDLLTIGGTDVDEIYASTTCAAIANHHIVLQNAYDAASTEPVPVVAADREVKITITSAGAAGTAGAGSLFLTYIDPTKADENYE